MSKIETDPERKLQKARVHMLLNDPFLGSLAYGLKFKERADVGTMATDGVYIFYAPEFVLQTSQDELCGVVAHETWHCAWDHIIRLWDRDPKRWNVATDYVINHMIQSQTNFKLPSDALLPPRELAGLDSDTTYARLPNDPDKQPDTGGCGRVMKPSENGDGKRAVSKADAKAIADAWRVRVVETATVCKARDKLPGWASDLIDDMLHPRMDWRSMLIHYATEMIKQTPRWTRPNRRHVHNGLYLPSKSDRTLGEIVFVIDSSASMIDDDMRAAFGAIHDIREQCNPTGVHVLCVDTQVAHHVHYGRYDPLPDKLPIHGRGGTDFRPAFDWVAERNIRPGVLLYLTDLYGSFPDADPGYPVIWLATEQPHTSVPFGKLVTIEH